jgi:hypothetical protein
MEMDGYKLSDGIREKTRMERTSGGLWTERRRDLIATIEMAIIRKGQL